LFQILISCDARFYFYQTHIDENERELSGSKFIIIHINETELRLGSLDGLNINAISLVDSADLDTFVPACNVCRPNNHIKHRNANNMKQKCF
jgi:hypothetical protein